MRISRLQQLAQIDFSNPRFMRDGKNADGTVRFAPLTFTAQYQRDSTITRFFRSVFDNGTFGIVQRIDENGNPIYREDGKVMKSSLYFKPDIGTILEK